MPSDAYRNTTMTSAQITSLMRRINALEAGVSGGAGGTYVRKWGTAGAANGQFNNPYYVSVYAGEVFVLDRDNTRIQVFDTTGTYIRKWSVAATCNGMCVDSGTVYVSDAGGRQVTKYDTSGGALGSFPISAAAPAIPNGLTVFGGEIYVCIVNVIASTRVEVFNSAGVLQRTIGSYGSGAGQFVSPVSVTGYSGEIYVADTGNDKIVVFTTAGTYEREFGSTGTGAGQFNSPIDIAIDAYSMAYVADSTNDNISVFSTAGVYQYRFGTTGAGNGELNGPRGLFVLSGELYVSEIGNDRVQVFTSGTAGITQTEFFSYTTTAATSLGTPDGGVSVPATNALKPAPDGNNADLIPRHIIDMRTAIETLAPYFTNALTGNPFNWTASSADNLYYVALGDRSHYGATGGAKYDWTRTEAQMEGDYCYSIDIGEIADTITLLEAS